MEWVCVWVWTSSMSMEQYIKAHGGLQHSTRTHNYYENLSCRHIFFFSTFLSFSFAFSALLFCWCAAARVLHLPFFVRCCCCCTYMFSVCMSLKRSTLHSFTDLSLPPSSFSTTLQCNLILDSFQMLCNNPVKFMSECVLFFFILVCLCPFYWLSFSP